MHLSEQLTNPTSAQKRVLEAFPDGVPRRRRQVSTVPRTVRQFGNGVVQRAVIRALSHGRTMWVADVAVAVERLLGGPVSNDSVGWCLRMGSRKNPPIFERVAYGQYRLSSQT